MDLIKTWIRSCLKLTNIFIIILEYPKPQIVPNLPIGFDDNSEVDEDWKAVSFKTYNKSQSYSSCNIPSPYGTQSNSITEEEGTNFLTSTG